MCLPEDVKRPSQYHTSSSLKVCYLCMINTIIQKLYNTISTHYDSNLLMFYLLDVVDYEVGWVGRWGVRRSAALFQFSFLIFQKLFLIWRSGPYSLPY